MSSIRISYIFVCFCVSKILTWDNIFVCFVLSPVFRIFSHVSYFVISCYLVAFVQDNEQEVRKEAVRVIEACLNLFGSLNPLGESLQLKTLWRHNTNSLHLFVTLEAPYKSYVRHVRFFSPTDLGWSCHIPLRSTRSPGCVCTKARATDKWTIAAAHPVMAPKAHG